MEVFQLQNLENACWQPSVKPVDYRPRALESSDFYVSRFFLEQFYLSFGHFCNFSSFNIQIFADWLNLVKRRVWIWLEFFSALKNTLHITVKIFVVFFEIDSSRALQPFELLFLHDLSHEPLVEGFVFFFIYWLEREIFLSNDQIRIQAFNCFFGFIFVFRTLGLESFLVNDVGRYGVHISIKRVFNGVKNYFVCFLGWGCLCKL